MKLLTVCDAVSVTSIQYSWLKVSRETSFTKQFAVKCSEQTYNITYNLLGLKISSKIRFNDPFK